MSRRLLDHTHTARKKRTSYVFTGKIILNNCKDDIMVSVLANNKGSLHLLCFSSLSRLQCKFSALLWSLFAIHFPSNSHVAAAHDPCPWVRTISKHCRGGQRSQTGNTGMPGLDNERAKPRMVGILLPAVDLVGSLSWNSWAVWRSPRGLAEWQGALWESVLFL